MREWWSKIRAIIRRQAGEERDKDLGEELDTHLEMEAAENGISLEEARRRFGNRTLIQENARDAWAFPAWEGFAKDLAYAVRMLRKNPAFALTAMLTLALGIGANTAMFSVIRAVLLKPLEYRDPDRLVYFSLENAQRNVHGSRSSALRLQEMRASARSFTGIAAYLGTLEDMTLSGAGEPEALKTARVSANFLDVLGVHPVAGRGFLQEEDLTGGPPVAMISEPLWKRRFNGAGLSGMIATLDSKSYAIVGVLPAGFAFPIPGADVWVPRPSEWSVFPPRYWSLPLLHVVARLAPGVTPRQAQAEAEVLNQAYIHAHPNRPESDLNAHLEGLRDLMISDARTMLWTLFGAVGFVLLIACANVASLMLARAASRSREFAVRASLGAARGRLIRQLLAESLLLSVTAGSLGVALARWSLTSVTRLDPALLPRAGEVRLDGTVLLFTALTAIVTGILFGLLPSLRASRPDLIGFLRESGAAPSSAKRGFFGLSAHRLLVMGQVALSIVLLIGAALLIRSFARLSSVNPGFEPARLLTMRIALPPARYDTDRKRGAFFSELAQRTEALPGVRAAAMAMSLPTTNWIRTNLIFIEGQPAPDTREATSFAVIESITPGYFRTLGIPLRRGREFNIRDNTPGAAAVIILNESLARRFWPGYDHGENPVGRHIGEGYDKLVGAMEIVGVVADTHEGGLAADAVQEFYIPTVVHPPQTAYLAARTEGDPLSFVNAVRSQVWAIDRDQSISEVRTMEDVLDSTLGQRRLTMLLLGTFAATALLLAMVGIYGVIAYSVAQRTQEVGIRRALGAQQSDILRLVLGQGLGLALAGIVLGIAGAIGLTRVMTSLLFHISATDPETFAGIALLFVIGALAASYLPARRAARTDPMIALRAG